MYNILYNKLNFLMLFKLQNNTGCFILISPVKYLEKYER